MQVKNFVPVNNSIDKLIAFAPSLSNTWRKHQRIESKPFYNETIDIVSSLKDKGWKVDGVYENRNKKSRKIANHCVKLTHPDLAMKIGNKNEGFANMYITNSCNGSSPLNMDFGMYRLVCSNGLVLKDIVADAKIKHTEKDYNRLPQIIASLEDKIQPMFKKFESFKNTTLTSKQLENLLRKASKIRDFDSATSSAVRNQLLNVHRDDDKGDDLWSVYNRLQENLIKSNMLVGPDGRIISGVGDPFENIRVNQDLYELVEAYA
jgi:hypothetical protein